MSPHLRQSQSAVPPPLDLPSPDLSPSQSWSSGTGIIPIILDPSLTRSPSEEMLARDNSDSFLFPPLSASSVGTFGQPVRRNLQQLGYFNRHASASTNTSDADAAVSSVSLQYLQTGSILPSWDEFHLATGPGCRSNSVSSAATVASSSCPLTRVDDEDLSQLEKGSLYTPSAYLASHRPSISGDAEKDNITLTDHTLPPFSVHTRDNDNIFSVEEGQIRKIGGVDEYEIPKSPLSTRHLNTNADGPMRCNKSELDLPLSPISAFLLSPSVSTSSDKRASYPAGHFPTFPVYLPSKYQAHCRAASAPLSTSPSHTANEDLVDIVHPALMSRRAVSTSEGRRFRSASNAHVKATTEQGRLSRSSHSDHPEVIMSGARSATMQELGSCAPACIQSTGIQLWIDQEGFRSIQPSFSLVEFWKGTGLSPDGQVLDVAEFKMKKQQTWHFHHATFESPPVLRRITVNGDMNDYISRQAVLTLKHNGVYAVESTEDKGKVAWKFEYLVEDRRAPETGKIINGEKRFTPLSFACNPELLTSEHGKKVKLLHFVKKSVTPKLQSFKLGPHLAIAPAPFAELESVIEDSGRCKETSAFRSFSYPSSHQPGAARARVRDRSNPCAPLDTIGEILPSRIPQKENPKTVIHSTSHYRLSRTISESGTTVANCIDDHVLFPRPGRRIMSPILLHAHLPPHEPPTDMIPTGPPPSTTRIPKPSPSQYTPQPAS